MLRYAHYKPMHTKKPERQPDRNALTSLRSSPNCSRHARSAFVLWCVAGLGVALCGCETSVPITESHASREPSRTLKPIDFSSGLGASVTNLDSRPNPTDAPRQPGKRTESLKPLDINSVTPTKSVGILASSDDAPAEPSHNQTGETDALTVGAGVEVLTPQQASEGLTNVIARAGTPELQVVDVTPIGEPVYIDGKLGDVNGKPIFASVFLDTGSATVEPVGRRLAEAAKQRPLNSWRVYARDEIRKRVGLFVRDEVLRAEALSTLSDEQKVGFVNWIEKLQRDAQRKSGASQAVTERTLMQTEGITLDEWKRREQDRQLIQLQLQERVGKRIQVSGRDIEQRYEQRADVYNRPPLASFRQIVVPGNKPEQIEEVTKRLAAGESFETLAKSELNISKRDTGGLEERELATARAEGNFFANQQLNNAARTMKEGEVFGPVDVSAGKAWIYLEKIENRNVDLYRAQLSIEQQLQSERFNKGLDRYFAKLESRVSKTSAEEIVDQLLTLAEKRYFVKK